MAKRRSLKDRATNFQPSAEEQEKALERLENNVKEKEQVKKKKPKKKTVRVSVDFPADLYEIIDRETEKSGLTKKGLIVRLVREHFDLL